jgi:copper transport protein
MRAPMSGHGSFGSQHGSRFWTILAAAVLVSALAPGVAQAHTILERSDPAANAVLTRTPSVVRLQFSSVLEPDLSRARIVAADGHVLRGVRLRAESSRLTLRPQTLRRGTYVVTWSVFAADDGHVGRGSLVFAVGERIDPNAAALAGDTGFPAEGALFRWLNFALLAWLVGALAVARFVLPTGHARTAAARRRILGWAALCGVQALVVGVGLLIIQAVAAADSPRAAWSLATGTRWGALWSAREALIGCLVVVALLLRGARGRAVDPLFTVSAIAAVALMTVQALMGHAAAVPKGVTVAVLADAAHLLAAAVWVGGLVALVAALWPLQGLDPFARAALRRFGAVAAVSVAVLGITGLYALGKQVASLDALLTTAYGGALLAKIGFMLAAGALGLMSLLLLQPNVAARLARLVGRPPDWRPVEPRRLRALILGEVCLGLLVVLAVGVVTTLAPARGPQFAPGPSEVASTATRSVDDLLVTVAVRPNRPGENVVDVRAVSTLRPEPAAIDRVVVRFAAPGGSRGGTARAKEQAPGIYRVSGLELDAAGRWQVETVVERRGRTADVASFDWTVAPTVTPRPVLVSNRPLESLLSGAAVALVFLIGSVLFGLIVWRWTSARATRARAV